MRFLSSGVVRRLVRFVMVLFLVTLVATFMLDLSGSPAADMAGDNATPEIIAAIEAKYGFDDSPPERYVRWIGDIVQGDFGVSYRTNQTVTEIVRQRLPVTIELMVLAMLITLSVSIALALATATKPGGRLDNATTMIGSAVASIPVFLSALILVYVFAIRVRWFPVTGWDALSDGLASNLRSAFLPALSLALVEIVVFQRVLRSDLIQTINEDFIASAYARGLSKTRVMVRHALRPSSLSTFTLAGLSMARLLAGAILIDQVFALPGLGNAFFVAVTNRDLVVVQGLVTFVALIYLLINLAVDLIYPLIDPRVRVH